MNGAQSMPDEVFLEVCQAGEEMLKRVSEALDGWPPANSGPIAAYSSRLSSCVQALLTASGKGVSDELAGHAPWAFGWGLGAQLGTAVADPEMRARIAQQIFAGLGRGLEETTAIHNSAGQA